MQETTCSARSFDWGAYVKILGDLSRLDKADPGPEMRAERARIEDLLLPQAPAIPHDGPRATVLEVAVQTGAARLVEALAPVGTKDLAKLKPGEWLHFACKHATPDIVRAAMKRDLSLEGVLNGIWTIAIDRPEWRNFLLEDVSRDRWWMPYPGMISRWFFDRSDESLACAFMRAQVAHHPDRAQNAMRLSGDHLTPFHEQIVLRRAGALLPEGVNDRLARVLDEEPSNHARMKTIEDFASLETIYRHYNRL